MVLGDEALHSLYTFLWRVRESEVGQFLLEILLDTVKAVQYQVM